MVGVVKPSVDFDFASMDDSCDCNERHGNNCNDRNIIENSCSASWRKKMNGCWCAIDLLFRLFEWNFGLKWKRFQKPNTVIMSDVEQKCRCTVWMQTCKVCCSTDKFSTVDRFSIDVLRKAKNVENCFSPLFFSTQTTMKFWNFFFVFHLRSFSSVLFKFNVGFKWFWTFFQKKCKKSRCKANEH